VRWTDHELSVGVSSREKAQSRQSFSIHISLSYSKRWRGCIVQPNGDASGWRMWRSRCTAHRDRLVLSDVDTCKREHTSWTQSSAEVATSAEGHECRQWCDRTFAFRSMIRTAAFSTFCGGRRWTAPTPSKTLIYRRVLSRTKLNVILRCFAYQSR